jgi:hypothetical protein
MHPTVWHFDAFLNENSIAWTYNTKRIQHIFSDACGYHCIFYALHRCVGFDMNAIINMYTNNDVYNDAIVKEFVTKKM